MIQIKTMLLALMFFWSCGKSEFKDSGRPAGSSDDSFAPQFGDENSVAKGPQSQDQFGTGIETDLNPIIPPFDPTTPVNPDLSGGGGDGQNPNDPNPDLSGGGGDGQIKYISCSMTTYVVMYHQVWPSSHRGWGEGSVNVEFPADAKDFSIKITRTDVDDGRLKVSINNNVVYENTTDIIREVGQYAPNAKTAYSTDMSLDVSSSLKAGANVFFGKAHDSWGTGHTAAVIIAGEYKSETCKTFPGLIN